MIHVRAYMPGDREFVLSLAPRLAIGIPPWRDTQKMAMTAYDWIAGSIERHGDQVMVFVAEDEAKQALGVATVSTLLVRSRHI